jgi:hypothetical protein
LKKQDTSSACKWHQRTLFPFTTSSSKIIVEDSFTYTYIVRSLGTGENQREDVSVISVFLKEFRSCYFPMPFAFSLSYRAKRYLESKTVFYWEGQTEQTLLLVDTTDSL